MKVFQYVVIGIVGTAVIAGFIVAGSPKEERLRQFDEQRVSNLQAIQSQIVYYWQSKGRLPEKLDDLNDPLVGFTVPKDPESKQDYEYRMKGPLTFELCGTFARPAGYGNRSSPYPMEPFGRDQQSWNHEAGHICFERTIDKDLFPPRKDTEVKVPADVPVVR